MRHKMTDKELEQWFEKVAYLEPTRDLIRKIRSSPPARTPSKRLSNVVVKYNSPVMGHMMTLESQAEYQAALHADFVDPNRIETWEQPLTITLDYMSRSNRRIVHKYTPDFFYINGEDAGFEEWKPQAELERLSQHSPYRYVKVPNGGWRCPPGETFAERYGLEFRLRSYDELNPTLLRNIEHLKYYLVWDKQELDPKDVEQVRNFVKRYPGIELRQMLGAKPPFVADTISRMLVRRFIYVDLTKHLLSEPEWASVYLDDQTAQAVNRMSAHTTRPVVPNSKVMIAPERRLTWDGVEWVIKNSGGSEVYLENRARDMISVSRQNFIALIGSRRVQMEITEDNKAEIRREILSRASPANIAQANRWFEIIKSGHVARSISPRTLAYKKARYRQYEQYLGDGYLGLIRQTWDRGKPGRKLDDERIAAMQTYVDRWLQPHAPSRRAIHNDMKQEWAEKNIPIVSYVSFCKQIHRSVSVATQKLRREGHRAAYAFTIQYWHIDMTTPRHGDRPWQICHIDHTTLDLEAIEERYLINLGRPYVTFAIDAFSRVILAAYVSFEPPSYRTCLMIMRILVKKYGRLPECIVTDGGPEFRSTYFNMICASYGTDKKLRPKDQPRTGSVVESLFGKADKEWVHNQLGNTQVMRRVRQVCRETDPKRLATYTLMQIQEALDEWADSHNNERHPQFGVSPNEMRDKGFEVSGYRPDSLIVFDEDFLRETMPTTAKGVAKIIAGRGLKVRGIYYSSPDIRRPEVERTSVAVRLDPWDIGSIQAHVKGRWVICTSEYHAILKGRSERDLRRVSEEIRRKYRISAVSAREIADAFKREDENPESSVRGLRSTEVVKVNNYVMNGEQPNSEPVMTSPAGVGEESYQQVDQNWEEQEEPSREEWEDLDSDTYGDYEQ